jgi:hypothetical protein
LQNQTKNPNIIRDSNPMRNSKNMSKPSGRKVSQTSFLSFAELVDEQINTPKEVLK